MAMTRITFSASGAHFRPGFVLGEEASLSLDYGDGSTPLAGTFPAGEVLPENHVFQDAAAVHAVVLTVSPPTALTVVNLGFLGGDEGNSDRVRDLSDLPLLPFLPPTRPDPFINEETAILDYAGTVTSIEGLSSAVSLIAFCCEWQPIEELDLSGCTALLTLEAYQSHIETMSLQNCTSLRRCCIEATGARYSWRMVNGIRIENESMDLSDCPDLRDIRGSADNHTQVWLHPDALNTLWHFCKWGNPRLTTIKIGNEAPGKMDVRRFRALRELWINSSPFLGDLIINNGTTSSIWGDRTGITSIDFSGQTQIGYVVLTNNDIDSINIDGCSGLVGLEGSNCGFTQAQVDYILATLDSFNRIDVYGHYRIMLADDEGSANRNAEPSATGLAHAEALRTRGWTITFNGD